MIIVYRSYAKKLAKNYYTSKSQSIHELINRKNLNECFLWFTVQDPLIWMSHDRTNNRKIDRLNEKCLSIINDKQTSLKE